MEEILKDVYYLCQACGTAIGSGCTFPEVTESGDLERLYRNAQKHMLDAMIGEYMLDHNIVSSKSELGMKIKKNLNVSVYRMMIYDNERNKLYEFFEDKGIWYLPLKGQILRDFYPKPYFRQMSDYDFLYDSTFQRTVEHTLEQKGFMHDESSRIDQSFKKMGVHFELHRALCTGTDDFKEMLEYYKQKGTGFMLADVADGAQYKRKMSVNDFYIYIVLHAYKHYSYMSGIGVRYLVDMYLFIQTMSTQLDYRYINKELCKVNAELFEQQMRKLALKAFNPAEMHSLDSYETELLVKMFNDGAYGDLRNLHNYRIEKLKHDKKGKVSIVKYIGSRIFPPKWQMEQVYAWSSKSQLFLLLAYFVRLMNAGRASKRFFQEIKEVYKIIRGEKSPGTSGSK